LTNHLHVIATISIRVGRVYGVRLLGRPKRVFKENRVSGVDISPRIGGALVSNNEVQMRTAGITCVTRITDQLTPSDYVTLTDNSARLQVGIHRNGPITVIDLNIVRKGPVFPTASPHIGIVRRAKDSPAPCG